MQTKMAIPVFLLLTVTVFFHAVVQAAEGVRVEGQDPGRFEINSSVKAINLKKLPEIAKLIPELSYYQAVFVGEQHPRFDHHLNQLAIIQGLYARYANLAIGVEFFQQPFQQYLDRYIAGNLSTDGLLDKTEYYDRWRYDFRLYAPILEFARNNHIPIVALNVPTEIIEKVGREGLKGLSKKERAQIPADIDYSNKRYEDRLKKVFKDHPQYFGKFKTFYEAQLVWDEAMAESAAHYLKSHPNTHMVVLAGNGHLAYGAGIPDRFKRRLSKISTVIILNDWDRAINPEIADYLLLSKEKELPKAGFLGVILDISTGSLEISDFSEDSPAKVAGMKEKDKILALNGHFVSKMSDVQKIMWDKKPGDQVLVKASRKADQDKDKTLEFEVKLR